MSFENTITEHDMDASTHQVAQNLQTSNADVEPDLDVDGLSDSIGARVKRFLSFGRD